MLMKLTPGVFIVSEINQIPSVINIFVHYYKKSLFLDQFKTTVVLKFLINFNTKLLK